MNYYDFRGCFTAIVTPFTPTGMLDISALKALTEWQISSGISGIVACGTTGESVTLTDDEYRQVIETIVQTSGGRVPVIAGAGGNNTIRVVELLNIAETAGADAILSVSPYYNKPTQEGLYQHFSQIAVSTKLPIILYNVPGRTASNLLPGTVLKLAEITNIIAIKEASGDLVQIMEILQHRPESFYVLSGDDALTLPTLLSGGDGVISVISNQIPGEFSQMVDAALSGDMQLARSIHYEFLDLMNINFIESNPVPVKAALAAMGRINPAVRLPLVPLQEKSQDQIMSVLNQLNLLDNRRSA